MLVAVASPAFAMASESSDAGAAAVRVSDLAASTAAGASELAASGPEIALNAAQYGYSGWYDPNWYNPYYPYYYYFPYTSYYPYYQYPRSSTSCPYYPWTSYPGYPNTWYPPANCWY
jgi:hypothetical protein